MKLEFSTHFFRKLLKYQILWKLIQCDPSCSMRTEGRKDRHDEANNRFSQIFEGA